MIQQATCGRPGEADGPDRQRSPGGHRLVHPHRHLRRSLDDRASSGLARLNPAILRRALRRLSETAGQDTQLPGATLPLQEVVVSPAPALRSYTYEPEGA